MVLLIYNVFPHFHLVLINLDIFFIFIKKNNMEYQFKTEWDYKNPENESIENQSEWNYTIIFYINHISALVHKFSLRGGVDTIVIHPSIEWLFNNNYYDNSTKMLLQRYQIKFDESINRNIIKLENLKLLDNLIMIPKKFDIGDEGNVHNMPIVKFEHINSYSQNEIDEYKSGLGGYIEILNLPE